MERDLPTHCRSVLLCAVIALGVIGGQAAALPLLTAPEIIEGLVVYPDDEDPLVFYYVPGALRLCETDGTPHFSFRRLRYVGTKLMGDQGTFRGRGDIAFTVEFEDIGDQVRATLDSLKRHRNKRAVLQPIPVDVIQTELVYSIIEDDEASRSERLASGLWAEPTTTPESDSSTGQWDERNFDIPLNVRTTQLLWNAYEENAVLLSLNYAIIAQGVSDLNVLPREAQRHLDELRRQMEGENGDAEFEPTDIELEQIARTVRADALQITVSPKKNPECFRSVDLDARIPAGYVFLEVYCFDFQNDPTTPVAKKRIEIRGTGVAGGRPKTKVDFDRNKPDEVSHEVRFELAVDLDKGFEYRVVEFDDDGNVTKGDWIAVNDWTGTLDVTREVEQRPMDEEAEDDEE